MKIYPSLISSNILELKKTIEELEPYCQGFHLDVMDDHFVPNLTWGPVFINAITHATSLARQVHLMVDNPETWVHRLNLSMQDSFIFHIEAVRNGSHARDIVQQLKAKKIRVGIALNPNTSVDSILGLLKDVDEVLVMSVEPGFSGQAFIQNVMEKVVRIRTLREKQNLSFLISMDGGIGFDNIAMIQGEGVDIVGVASAIFSRKDTVRALKDLQGVLKP
ncbi:MAG: ribulose-phosphate 3-epimerase [bacterium]